MEKLFQGLNKHRIWGYEIFSVPLYLFLFLAVMVFAANQMDVIPGSMVGSIGAMFVIGITWVRLVTGFRYGRII